MLKINRADQSFLLLDTPTLADVSITERYDLQEFIANSPQVFFKEIGQDLFLLGKEIKPSSNVEDRIDLLAIDREGACVVVELKRGNHKLHMFQAISYAGMISQWSAEDFLELLNDDQQDALAEFLEVDSGDINRQQRVILVAEAYDFALLTGAEWLSEQYGVGIVCCRIAIAHDTTTNAEYLVCSNVYPAPELSKEAVPRGRARTGSSKLKWQDWDEALASVTNSAVVDYYRQQLDANRETYLRKRILLYRVAGKRRWFLAARNKNAYLWQYGRFDNDLEFWQSGMSDPSCVQPVKNGECLRMFLDTVNDFRYFHDAATNGLVTRKWSNRLAEEELEEVAE